MIIEFDSAVWQWDARTESWWFASVPEALSADIRELPRPPRGFGAVRVRARIGATGWSTSIFPDAGSGTYSLPLKRAVRDAEAIGADSIVRVRLEIVD